MRNVESEEEEERTVEVASVQSSDRGSSRSEVGTFDVDVSLRRRSVDVDVKDSAVFVALLDHIVLQLILPMRTLVTETKPNLIWGSSQNST